MARLNEARARRGRTAPEAVTVTSNDIATIPASVLAAAAAPEPAPPPEPVAEAPKPAPQRVAVEGFSPFASGESPDTVRTPRDELAKLPKLPPFQMFIEETWPNEQGIPSDKFAVERARARVAQIGGEQFLAAYEAWHAAKGLWPHETPYGRAR